MSVRFSDWQHDDSPLEGERFDDATQLWNAILGLRCDQRYLIELEHSNGASLVIGVGAELAPVQFTGTDAIAHGAIGEDANRDDDIEFLCGDTPTPVRRRNCLSSERVRRLVTHFVATGERDCGVAWEFA